MRKLKTLFALLVLSFITIGNLWGTEQTLTESEIKSNFSSSAHSYGGGSASFDDGDVNWYLGDYSTTASSKWIQIKKDQGVYLKITTPENTKITEVSLTITSATNSKGGAQDITMHTAYSGRIALLTADAAGSTTMTGVGYTESVSNNSASISASGTNRILYLKTNGAARIWGASVTYESTSSKTLESVAVDGTPTKIAYAVGDAFDPAGLSVTGTYSDATSSAITSGITWTACKTEDGTYVALDNAAVALAQDETGIYVKATASEITSPAFHVTGLSVQAALTDDEFAWNAASFEATKGGENTFPTLINTIPVTGVTYQSTDETVATISNEEGHEGEITLLKSGETTIKAIFAGNASYAAKTVSYTLTVIVPVESVSVKASTTLEVGDTEKLTATINPSGATNKNVTWESSNPSVATVSDAGVVTAVAAGSANITCKSAADNTKTATCAVTVNPVHVYQYTHDFTQIDMSSWSGSYAAHPVKYTSYGTQPTDSVYFASASSQSSTISDRPVTKDADVKFILLDNSKYISAVKFECKQWASKTTTMTMQYSTDGGESFTAFNPAVSASLSGSTTGATCVVKCLNLPEKVNAVKISGSNSSSQVGISSVSFDIVDKVTYAVAQSTTGCTLSVLKGETPVENPVSLEEGDQLTVSIASTETGYENAGIAIKKTSDNSDVTTSVLSGSTLTVPNYGITIVGTATKIQYTVTLSATNGTIQVGGVNKTSITVPYGETAELTAAPAENYAFQSWATEDAGISLGSTSDNPMTITVTGDGTVTATFINTAKTNPNLSWNNDAVEAVKGQAAPTWPSLTNTYDVSVAYSSTNTNVATISNAGVVSIVGVGSTTIKATHAEDATYAASEASYTLTVKGRITWHVTKEDVESTQSADYVKDAVPTKPTGDFVTSCDEAISLVGWTTEDYKDYFNSTTAPTVLYTGDVPAVTDNADYYAVWAIIGKDSEVSITKGVNTGGIIGESGWTNNGAGTYKDHGLKFDTQDDDITSPNISSQNLNTVVVKFKAGYNSSQSSGSIFTIYAYNSSDVVLDSKTCEPATDYNDQNDYSYTLTSSSVIAYIKIALTTKQANVGMEYAELFKIIPGTTSIYATNCDPANVPTAIDNTIVIEKATKFIQNGQLFIESNGRIYNAMGQLVK